MWLGLGKDLGRLVKFRHKKNEVEFRKTSGMFDYGYRPDLLK